MDNYHEWLDQLKIGDLVFVDRISYSIALDSLLMSKAKVIRMGKTFFEVEYVEKDNRQKFDRQTGLLKDSNSFRPIQIHPFSEEEDRKQKALLMKYKLVQKMKKQTWENYPLEVLSEVNQILVNFSS